MIDAKVLLRIKAGATVKVFEKVILEEGKSRTSQFEGIVLARKHGEEAGASFTVRGTVAGVGVEKLFPIHSTLIEKVEIISSPKKVSRAKIYYIRDISRARIRKKLSTGSRAPEKVVVETLEEAEAPTEATETAETKE